MARTILASLLVLSAMCISGCATIVGGVIGHQSGEAVAGATIGAAVDFGDDIVRGIGDILAGEKVSVHSELGYIRVNRDRAKSRNLLSRIEKKLRQSDWLCRKTDTSSPGDRIERHVYQCRTAQGQDFTLEYFCEPKQDVRIYVSTPDKNTEMRAMLTSQVGLWTQKMAG